MADALAWRPADLRWLLPVVARQVPRGFSSHQRFRHSFHAPVGGVAVTSLAAGLWRSIGGWRSRGHWAVDGRVAARRPTFATAARDASANVVPACTLLLDPLSPVLAHRLVDRGCEVHSRIDGESVPEALQRVRPRIIIVRSSLLKESQLGGSGAERLKLVMRAGAGVDNIAVQHLTEQGVIVSNAAGANAIAVAELTMAHLLNLDRRLCDQVESLRRGDWRRLEFARGARGLFGSSLAVLGFGHIGREVVKRALAFGMEVRVWSRSLTSSQAAEHGAIWCATPRSAVDGADALSVHLPLTEDTQGLVDEELLGLLRPGALVVNMSRGGVVDETALLRACITSGLRAGLDVFAKEPDAKGTIFEDAAICESQAVYGTHHTGARTAQAAQAVEDAVVAAVDAYLSGRAVPGIVGR